MAHSSRSDWTPRFFLARLPSYRVPLLVTHHISHIIYISHITHYTHHTLHSHSHHNSIADAWDRTRAACVGVQHATEWATRCPYNTSLFSIFIVNVHAHCMLHSQQFSFIFKILLQSILITNRLTCYFLGVNVSCITT